jgi:MOSC domain-containing protein YiiM
VRWLATGEGQSEPLPFGVYCEVVEPGRVQVGDAVTASVPAVT